MLDASISINFWKTHCRPVVAWDGVWRPISHPPYASDVLQSPERWVRRGAVPPSERAPGNVQGPVH